MRDLGQAEADRIILRRKMQADERQRLATVERIQRDRAASKAASDQAKQARIDAELAPQKAQALREWRAANPYMNPDVFEVHVWPVQRDKIIAAEVERKHAENRAFYANR